ncbi:MAG: T9SS type A sorting domain-containing protein, partial [Bacteroidia bacterium]|nr:T9SS type A sorting domain-containing protein [Bacteroidia bacterium]
KPSPLNIGCTHASNNRPFGGYIAEVIIYTVTVNNAQRIIVNNYLSSKYDIALSANDKYAGDTPGNGNYDREVAGIGREGSGSNPTFSASISGGITIANTGGLDGGDYILAGHASPTNMQITYDVGGMTGINNARWLRIWYLDVTNTSTALTNTIEFDMSDGGVGAVPIATAGNYVLLYRTGQTGNWTELTTASSISGDRVIFSGITLSNDGYYTIGTRNFLVSPLPVELTRFEAVANGDAVDISWTTASEKDNAFFTIEKSRDGISFETLTTRDGAGSSTSVTNYHEQDGKPFEGISYYRLKQQDLSGRVNYPALVAVDRNQYMDAKIVVFPNPSDGNINLIVKGFEKQTIDLTISDAMGRVCFYRSITVQEAEETIGIYREDNLAPGSYVLTIGTKDAVYKRKVAVRQ